MIWRDPLSQLSHLRQLRRHGLTLLLLALLVAFVQSQAAVRMTRMLLSAPTSTASSSLEQLGLADVCHARTGDEPTQPAGNQSSHNCCIACVGLVGGAALPTTQPPVPRLTQAPSGTPLVRTPLRVRLLPYQSPPSRAPPLI